MHYHSLLVAIPVLVLQCTLAAPATNGGDGSNGHGGGWGYPGLGGPSDFNKGANFGDFDNSHCNNNNNNQVTTTITTCPADSATTTTTTTATTTVTTASATTTVTTAGATTTVTTGSATVTVPASTTTITSTETDTTTITSAQDRATTTVTVTATTTFTAGDCEITDPSTPSYGSCSDPTILWEDNLDGRTDYSFTTRNQADFPFGSSPDIDPVTALICNRLRSPCNAPDATVQRCLEAADIANQFSGQEAADVWNELMT